MLVTSGRPDPSRETPLQSPRPARRPLAGRPRRIARRSWRLPGRCRRGRPAGSVGRRPQALLRGVAYSPTSDTEVDLGHGSLLRRWTSNLTSTADVALRRTPLGASGRSQHTWGYWRRRRGAFT